MRRLGNCCNYRANLFAVLGLFAFSVAAALRGIDKAVCPLIERAWHDSRVQLMTQVGNAGERKRGCWEGSGSYVADSDYLLEAGMMLTKKHTNA